jgi:hypothetical protein
MLDLLVGEFSSDESLDGVDSSLGVSGGLILGGFSDESLIIIEGDDGGGNSVS